MSQRPSTTALSTAPRPPPRRTGEAKPEKQRPVTPPPIIVNKREKIEFTLGEFLGQVTIYNRSNLRAALRSAIKSHKG